MIKLFQIHGEVRLNISFGKTTNHHVAYVTYISDLFILGLDLLKENNFKLDFLKDDNLIILNWISRVKNCTRCQKGIELFKTKNLEIKSFHRVSAVNVIVIPLRIDLIFEIPNKIK